MHRPAQTQELKMTRHAQARSQQRAISSEIIQTDLAVTGFLTKFRNLLLDVGEAHLVRIAQDGHHQTTRRSDGDTNIEIAVVNDVVAID